MGGSNGTCQTPIFKVGMNIVTNGEADFVLITNMNMKYFRPTHNGRVERHARKKDLFWNKRSRLVILVML